MEPIASHPHLPTRYAFIGGAVCLDFTNTVSGVRGGRSHDDLISYAALVSWSQRAGLVTESEAEALRRKAASEETEAAVVLWRAHALREAIYHLFTALLADKQPSDSDLETFNRELERGTSGATLVLTSDGLQWVWRKQGGLDQMLGPLARSAATLLTSTERHLVRQCANPRCGWFFVDTTRNHSRHWCRTAVCGNNVRVRRHRHRQPVQSTLKEQA